MCCYLTRISSTNITTRSPSASPPQVKRTLSAPLIEAAPTVGVFPDASHFNRVETMQGVNGTSGGSYVDTVIRDYDPVPSDVNYVNNTVKHEITSVSNYVDVSSRHMCDHEPKDIAYINTINHEQDSIAAVNDNHGTIYIDVNDGNTIKFENHGRNGK